MSQPRVRFAPSPTGSLHIGGARTALFNYLFAKHYNGTFVLRIEDTDLERSTDTALQSQLADLSWLGITWDEGVNVNFDGASGELGPYKQSERLDIYEKYLQQLLFSGDAYYCFLTAAEIDAQKSECIAQGLPYRPSSKYRDLPLNQAQELLKTKAAVVRLKAPEVAKTYVVEDLVRGKVSFSTDQAGDFVIMRSNGMPMYNFCCVVDDALMQITHVFRGEEHLTNTLRQLMLFDVLNFKSPKYAHASVILGKDGKKLSKRDGAVACGNYRDMGYLPAALLNYIALLGWNDGSEQEIYSVQELVEKFSVERLNAAAPVFDPKKFAWVNSQHIRQLPSKVIWDMVVDNLALDQLSVDCHASWGELFIDCFKDNLVNLTDVKPLYQKLTQLELSVDDSAQDVLQWDTSAKVIDGWLNILQDCKLNYLDSEFFANALKCLQQQLEVKGKFLFMPLRVAMFGSAHGAELKLLIKLLPVPVLLARAKQVQKIIAVLSK